MSWKSRSRLERESKLLELTNSAYKSYVGRDCRQAVKLNSEAMNLVRQLAKEFPDYPEYDHALGTMLYSHANFLSEMQRHDESLKALAECEEVYSRLPQNRFPVSALTADVAARCGLIHARLGAVASAVTEMQWSVRSYFTLSGGKPEDPYYIDLARVLASNAIVQAQFGDPDLAVASADTAVRMFLGQRDRINARPDSTVYSTSAVNALAVAVVIHKAQGREDISREAADLGSRFTTQGPTIDVLIARNEEIFRGRRPPLSLSEALDAAATRLGREQVPEGLHKFAKLEERDAGAFPQVTPLDRFGTTLQLAPGFASAIASVAMNMMPHDADAGLWLGLEAHYLFAGASRAQTMSMRHQFHEFGPDWERVLLECSRVCHSRQDSKALALDLDAWARVVAMRLNSPPL